MSVKVILACLDNPHKPNYLKKPIDLNTIIIN